MHFLSTSDVFLQKLFSWGKESFLLELRNQPVFGKDQNSLGWDFKRQARNPNTDLDIQDHNQSWSKDPTSCVFNMRERNGRVPIPSGVNGFSPKDYPIFPLSLSNILAEASATVHYQFFHTLQCFFTTLKDFSSLLAFFSCK